MELTLWMGLLIAIIAAPLLLGYLTVKSLGEPPDTSAT